MEAVGFLEKSQQKGKANTFQKVVKRKRTPRIRRASPIK